MKAIDTTEIVDGATIKPVNYRVRDVETGLHNLFNLLDMASQVYFDTAPAGSDERLGTLLWIARDLAAGVEQAHQREIEGAMA